MLQDIVQLKKLTLEDRHGITNFIRQFPPYNDFEFLSLWVYNVNNITATSILNDNLIIKIQNFTSGESFYSFLGTNKVKETTIALLHQSKKENLGNQLRLVPESTVRSSPELFNDFSVKEDLDSFDYILSVDEIAEMSGGKFQEKRNLVSTFMRLYNNSYIEQIDFNKKSNTDGIIDLFFRWEEQKGKTRNETDIELAAIKRLIDVAPLLDIKGLGVYCGEVLIGFIAYHIIHDNYAIISFEKGDTKYKGIYEYIKNVLAKKLRILGIKYINYEQDLGIPGLRKAKQLWRPISFLKKYTIEKSF